MLVFCFVCATLTTVQLDIQVLIVIAIKLSTVISYFHYQNWMRAKEIWFETALAAQKPIHCQRKVILLTFFCCSNMFIVQDHLHVSVNTKCSLRWHFLEKIAKTHNYHFHDTVCCFKNESLIFIRVGCFIERVQMFTVQNIGASKYDVSNQFALTLTCELSMQIYITVYLRYCAHFESCIEHLSIFHTFRQVTPDFKWANLLSTQLISLHLVNKK